MKNGIPIFNNKKNKYYNNHELKIKLIGIGIVIYIIVTFAIIVIGGSKA